MNQSLLVEIITYMFPTHSMPFLEYHTHQHQKLKTPLPNLFGTWRGYQNCPVNQWIDSLDVHVNDDL